MPKIAVVILVICLTSATSFMSETGRTGPGLVVRVTAGRNRKELLPISSAFGNGWNGKNSVSATGLIPWRCFVKLDDRMCSCTILTENYILARSGCISSTQTGKIQVHAGASDAANADQVVDACLLDTAERPPEGVVVLLLAKNLTFDANVRSIKLIYYSLDTYPGVVSGFHFDKGIYQLEHYSAKYVESSQGRLNAAGQDWPELNNEVSKATDFLDFYDANTSEFIFVGVLENHYGSNNATYYEVRQMWEWMHKHLAGIGIRFKDCRSDTEEQP